MKTIRTIIDSLKADIETLRDENENLDTSHLEDYCDELTGVVYDLESANNEVINAVEKLKNCDYLQDLYDDTKPVLDQNSKILY